MVVSVAVVYAFGNENATDLNGSIHIYSMPLFYKSIQLISAIDRVFKEELRCSLHLFPTYAKGCCLYQASLGNGKTPSWDPMICFKSISLQRIWMFKLEWLIDVCLIEGTAVLLFECLETALVKLLWWK